MPTDALIFDLDNTLWDVEPVIVRAEKLLAGYLAETCPRILERHTPDSMRGRVGAVSSLFISASNELGEAESGFLAALVGPVAAVVAGGFAAIGVTLLWAAWFPELRRAKSFEAAEEGKAPA